MISSFLNSSNDLHNDLHVYFSCRTKMIKMRRVALTFLFCLNFQSARCIPPSRAWPLFPQSKPPQTTPQIQFSNVSIQRARGVNSLCQAGSQGQGEVVNEIMLKSETWSYYFSKTTVFFFFSPSLSFLFWMNVSEAFHLAFWIFSSFPCSETVWLWPKNCGLKPSAKSHVCGAD